MKKLMHISALTLVTVGLLAPADIQMTQGEPNGRFWHGANGDWKVGYVMGYTAAYTSYLDMYRAAYGTKPRYELIWFKGHPLYNEVVDGVTNVYKEPANAVFPVSTALSIVALKIQRGVSTTHRILRGDKQKGVQRIWALTTASSPPPTGADDQSAQEIETVTRQC